MITLLLIFFPLVAGLLLLFVKGQQAKTIALGASILEFAIAVFALTQFQHNAATQFEWNHAWIQSMGITFHVGIDGISMLLVLLTTFLVPVIILTSYKTEYKNPSAFYSLILVMQMALVGVFVSLDGFLFYVFWEVALIPVYFLSSMYGGARRIPVTFKFFVYTFLGSLLMLVAFLYIYQQTPIHSFSWDSLVSTGKSISPANQQWLFHA